MSDDIKAFYLEAATAQPGRSATSGALNDWLYKETALGAVLYDLRDKAGGVRGPAREGHGRRPDPTDVRPTAVRTA